jgi:hypothetical protein
MEQMTSPPLDWLLVGEPWIEYRARLDLLGQNAGHPQVLAARRSMLADPRVQALLAELSSIPWTVISSHKSAGQPFHKLTFLSDLGLQADDPGMSVIISHIREHRSPQGPFQMPMNIPTGYGGSGRDQWAWALCDAPLLLYALARFGLHREPDVQAAAAYLASLVRENGFPCVVSKELGSFRGPGRKDDPCPFATLAMLKALSGFPEYRDGPAVHTGAKALLSLWQDSLTRHPYIFYMGTDFRKLKVPFIWYDLVHVLEVLSNFPWLHHDPRFLGMLSQLKDKADSLGRFTLESVWTAWKNWEFGQKKEPSRWLTLPACRIISRVESSLIGST